MYRWLIAGLLMLATGDVQAETLRLYAAGSLKAALTEVVQAFEAEQGGALKVEPTFGASGLLRERIEAGEGAHVFASADMGHPRRLVEQGRAVAPVHIFARNRLCALAREGLRVGTDDLLERMLDATVLLGTSTPKADPSGDYAYALFARAEALKPGAKAALEAKALQLTGGPASPKAPDGRNLYAWTMTSGQADLFLTYCTNAVLAKADVPALSIVAIAPSLAVGADYGLVLVRDAPAAAGTLLTFIRSAKAQTILARYGFGAGD